MFMTAFEHFGVWSTVSFSFLFPFLFLPLFFLEDLQNSLMDKHGIPHLHIINDNKQFMTVMIMT